MGDTVLLVEGESDRRAVLALANKLERDLAAEGVDVVPMGGATPVAAFVSRYRRSAQDPLLVGLCDINERRYFERVLPPEDIFVCDADLEDELIRAIGSDEMVDFIESQGELKAFQIFQKQPAQRDRTLHQHLHRFCGTLGGRNIRYAPAIIDRLPLARVPSPLRSLVDWV